MKINNCIQNFKANKMSLAQAKYFQNKLEKAKKVDIICHEDSDLDTVNSAMVLSDYLESLGTASKIILSQNIQDLKLRNDNYNFIQANNFNTDKKHSDLVVCVDFSSKGRVNSKIANYIQNSPNVICFDHHRGIDLTEGNYTYINSALTGDEHIKSVTDYYIDSSAKSTTSILYRFFEALNLKIPSKSNYDLLYGFMDDALKRGLIKCEKENVAISVKKELSEDKNANEIFCNLSKSIKKEDLQEIINKIDIMSNLNKEESAFYNSLHQKIKYSPNNHIAYVEIPPNDKTWKELGEDNVRTSTILNRFRQDVIENKFNDKNLNNIKCVAVFYKAGEKYRISLHSKEPILLDFINYFQNNSKTNLTESMGGHRQRSGGCTPISTPEICHSWVEDIVNSDSFFE